MCIRIFSIGIAMIGLLAVCPVKAQSLSNAYRLLVVYTNSTEALYPGINMYRDHVQGIIEGMNQAYEDSELETRVELAGLIWDKVYNRTDSPFSYGDTFVKDLRDGTNGLGRYVAMRQAYSADVILFLHQSSVSSAGAGVTNYTGSGSFAPAWVNGASGVYTWAHEIGHIHRADHCNGYRLTLDSIGAPIQGPFAYRLTGSPMVTTWMDSVVISDTRKPHSGFHTTMAYSVGNNCDTTSDVHYYVNTSHTRTGTYSWKQDGQHPVRPQWIGVADPLVWAGVFANPDFFWQDTLTSVFYPTGKNNFPIRRRLQYVGSPTPVVDDTLGYRNRNYVYFDTTYGPSVRNLAAVPSGVTLTSANSLGANSADSQWVYSHVAALDSVKIQSGFKVKEGSYLKISVGTPVSGLSKSSRSQIAARQEGLVPSPGEVSSLSLPLGAWVRYDAAARLVHLRVNADTEADLTMEIFDLRGSRMATSIQGRTQIGENHREIPVGNLKNGVYFVRMKVASKSHVLRFVKR